MTYGAYRSANEAVNTFVYDELVDAALHPNPPKTFNVSRQFASFLVGAARFNKLIADEEADRQLGLIRRRLREAIDQWSGLGLPAPIGFAENDDIILTWKHARYTQITGYEPLSLQFVRIYDWLCSLGSRDFLFACATFLRIIGCDPIFVTDGARDQGIDCIGRVSDGPIRSVLFFVQCKTRQQAAEKVIGKEVIYQEYGKYATLPKTRKYRDYMEALDLETSRDGAANVYVIVSNGEFAKNSQEVARNLGILLRSARQLAYFFSLSSTVEELKDLHTKITIPSGPDLNKNVAPSISFG